jgi:hypothetical protein
MSSVGYIVRANDLTEHRLHRIPDRTNRVRRELNVSHSQIGNACALSLCRRSPQSRLHRGRTSSPKPAWTVQVVAGQSIQEAIDGAATDATVCVGPGTYQENLLINKDGITLKGAGPENTVLVPPTEPRTFCPVMEITPIGPEPLGRSACQPCIPVRLVGGWGSPVPRKCFASTIPLLGPEVYRRCCDS